MAGTYVAPCPGNHSLEHWVGTNSLLFTNSTIVSFFPLLKISKNERWLFSFYRLLFFNIIVITALTQSMGDCGSISFSTLLGKLSFSAWEYIVEKKCLILFKMTVEWLGTAELKVCYKQYGIIWCKNHSFQPDELSKANNLFFIMLIPPPQMLRPFISLLKKSSIIGVNCKEMSWFCQKNEWEHLKWLHWLSFISSTTLIDEFDTFLFSVFLGALSTKWWNLIQGRN